MKHSSQTNAQAISQNKSQQQSSKQLLLASKSPRRKELLAQLGYQFTTTNSDIDESTHSNELPQDYVLRLAIAKAQYAFNQLSKTEQQHTLVLGSDTTVVAESQILGKPTNEADSARMLTLLSDKAHQVFTSIAVVGKDMTKSTLVTTQVNFKALSKDEMHLYWHSAEPQDKAGSYGIQGIGGQFVKSIEGSYSAVVGLPLYETAMLLSECGLPTSLQQKQVIK
ncbi:MAG: Maf family protein [Colwellia sp.]